MLLQVSWIPPNRECESAAWRAWHQTFGSPHFLLRASATARFHICAPWKYSSKKRGRRWNEATPYLGGLSHEQPANPNRDSQRRRDTFGPHRLRVLWLRSDSA